MRDRGGRTQDEFRRFPAQWQCGKGERQMRGWCLFAGLPDSSGEGGGVREERIVVWCITISGGSLLRSPLHRQDDRPLPQPVQVIGPQLHHLPTFLKVRGAVIGSSEGVAHGMGQLMLNQLRLNL